MTRYMTPGPAPPACLPWCDDHDAGEGLCRRLLAEAEYDDGDTMEAWLIGSCHNDVVTLDVDGQRIEHPDEAKLLELFGLGLEKQLYVSHDVDVASPGAREKGHMSWCELAGDHRMCHRIIYQDECDGGTPDEQGFKVMFFGTPGRSVSMWIGYAADGAMYDIDKTVALRKILSEWVPRIHFWHGANSLASPGSGFDVIASAEVRTKWDNYKVAALIDRDGQLGEPGGRVLALTSGSDDWNDGDTVFVPASQLDEVADTLNALTATAKVATPPIDENVGGVLVGRRTVGGVEMAAYHDWGGDLFNEGDGVVALGYNGPRDKTDDVEWGYLLDIGFQAERLHESEIAAIIAGLRQMAGQIHSWYKTDFLAAPALGDDRMTAPPTDPKLDKAHLDGRITLAPGENLVASRKLAVHEGDLPLLAATDTMGQVGLHIAGADHDAPRYWRGNADAFLHGAEADAFRQALEALPAIRREALDRLTAEYVEVEQSGDFARVDYHSSRGWTFPNDMPQERRDQIFRLIEAVNGEDVETGVLASGPWGELRYELQGPSSRDEGGLDETRSHIVIGVKPPGADDDWTVDDAWNYADSGVGFSFAPKQFKQFIQAVGELLDMVRSRSGNRQQDDLVLPSL